MEGKEPELVWEVVWYQLGTVRLDSMHSSGSGIKILERGWISVLGVQILTSPQLRTDVFEFSLENKSDWNLTWYTSRPDLTQCFQHTVLVWFPCVYLWTCSPLYLLYLQFRTHRGVIPLSKLCCSKTLLGLSLASFGLLEMFYLVVKKNEEIHNHLVILLGPLIRSLTLVLAVVIIQVERMKGSRSSVLLFLFWTLLVLCSIAPLRVNIEQIIDQGFSSDAVRFVAFFICFSLQLTELVLSCFSDRRPLSDKHTYAQNQCPEEDASFLSKFFFFWISSFVIQGYRRPLQAADLWSLRDQDSSIQIMLALEKFWAQNCKQLQEGPAGSGLSGSCSRLGASAGPTEKTHLLKKIRKGQGSGLLLINALGRSFGPYFLCGTLCLLLHDAFMFAVPQVLSALLGFMRDKDAAMWKGFLFASLLFLLSCLQSALHHQYMFHCFTVGMRLKTAVIGLVYRKSLVMSSSARRQFTLGEIINLVSADTQKLMDFVVYFNSVWIAPIEIALCFYFLWRLLGASALAGITPVLLIFPLNGLIAKMRSKLQEVQMKFMDGRIKLMNEILSGVKILKFYAWEEAFLRRVGVLRDGELNALKKSQILYSLSLASFNSSSFLIALSVFGVYVLIDERNVLDAQKIFVSVALINILKTPLSQLPFAMNTTMQAIVSLRRLTNFLCQDELNPNNVERLPHSKDGDDVVIEGGFFSWSHDGSPCLQRINMKVKTGSLVAVVGHVGSGKSSLLSAMLGEMERRHGFVSIEGSVGYVPQQAWIQNASLKDNILFGGERKESWYHRVLEACALLPDLDLLPAGDSTEIGEKGLNLSGGQKQRISLARAVYRKSDVYLLDDPLSAVDAQVGQHIFDRVIGSRGLLKDKTRVLVTHGLSFLSKADLVLVMEQGQISEMGSYMELMDRKGAFAKLIQTFNGNHCRETATLREKSSRKSVSRLSTSDFSIDLSQEQLISCDMSSASVQVMEAVDQDLDALDAGKLTEVDKAQTGRVKLQMYKEYFRTIGLTFIMTIIFLCAFQQATSLAYNYWLSLWADETLVNGTQSNHELKMSVFALLGFTQGMAMFGTTLAIALGGILASRQLHADLLHSVLHSSMSFFEVTPSGNLLNRFSKDIDAIDCMIPDGLKMMLGYLFKLLEVCIIVLLATPFTGLVLLPLTCVYILIQSFYVASSCQLRRLEAVSRSPIYSHFNETLQGAAVIRAFGERQRFVLQADSRIDNNQEAYFPRFGWPCLGRHLPLLWVGFITCTSRQLHADLLHSVLHSSMSFFEVTPSGNLLNRFSKDIDAIDCMIPDGLKMMLGYLFKLLEVCIIVLLATPFTGLVLLPLTCVYILIQSFYVASSCQLRRLEAVSRSPIYSHFNETLQGAAVIRAFGERQRFVLQADSRIDNNQEAYFPRFVATRWLAVNLEFLGNLLVLAAAILSVRGRDELSPGIVGLAVSHSLQVTGILSWIVRSWTDVENNIVSVERVKEYETTPKEAAWTVKGSLLPAAWPTTGTIQFEDYGLQYRKGLDWALKDISINVQNKEKVGIVGRTGAGKSSLALGLFRILEAAKGRIFIDGINIAKIGLHDLRSRITIIPQEPLLFSGSLRMNLDPFDTCSDEDLWKVLELAHLSSFVSALPQKLNHQCCEGGENLSLGQRQLLCLARALLRKTRILVLDEATAAVDLKTDQLIQSTIRTQFDDCTVLTIAHRLNTIMDYTRVIVMDRGCIAEMDSPSQLIRLQGHFYQMCLEAGLA
ncbi:multidrug resistance-associated protein 1-like [Xiphias gladius]|uniref:multidrug resistance-associated protein 1-like n=1 Tax=Xiphias gladius TaxID=8245 RepID=UPI001A9850F6|nr:multidrug resistance-associated protein 1-like [Xiphias gladius]